MLKEVCIDTVIDKAKVAKNPVASPFPMGSDGSIAPQPGEIGEEIETRFSSSISTTAVNTPVFHPDTLTVPAGQWIIGVTLYSRLQTSVVGSALAIGYWGIIDSSGNNVENLQFTRTINFAAGLVRTDDPSTAFTTVTLSAPETYTAYAGNTRNSSESVSSLFSSVDLAAPPSFSHTSRIFAIRIG